MEHGRLEQAVLLRPPRDPPRRRTCTPTPGKSPTSMLLLLLTSRSRQGPACASTLPGPSIGLTSGQDQQVVHGLIDRAACRARSSGGHVHRHVGEVARDQPIPSALGLREGQRCAAVASPLKRSTMSRPAAAWWWHKEAVSPVKGSRRPPWPRPHSPHGAGPMVHASAEATPSEPVTFTSPRCAAAAGHLAPDRDARHGRRPRRPRAPRGESASHSGPRALPASGRAAFMATGSLRAVALKSP